MWALCDPLFLIENLRFEWNIAGFVVKNGHQNNTWYNEIGLSAQIYE